MPIIRKGELCSFPSLLEEQLSRSLFQGIIIQILRNNKTRERGVYWVQNMEQREKFPSLEKRLINEPKRYPAGFLPFSIANSLSPLSLPPVRERAHKGHFLLADLWTHLMMIIMIPSKLIIEISWWCSEIEREKDRGQQHSYSSFPSQLYLDNSSPANDDCSPPGIESHTQTDGK